MITYSYSFLLCFISISYCFTIPSRTPGHSIGNSTAPIHLEMFIDWQCSDSKQSWQIIPQVLEHYGTNNIYFTLHVLQLWFFRQSGDLALCAEIIAQHGVVDYLEMATYFFQVQPMFYNSVYGNKTEQDLYNDLWLIAKKFGVDNNTYWNEITEWETGTIWDTVNTAHVYARTQMILGTPSFVVNGFKDPSLDENTTYQEWVAYIDALLSSTK